MNTKPPILLLYFLFFAGSYLQAQRFQGEIGYKIYFIAKNPTVDTALLRQQARWSFSTYIVNSKAYKSSYFKDGALTYSYTYEPETALMYDEEAGQPFVTYRDSRKSRQLNTGPVTVNKDSTQQLLGYRCYLLTTQSGDQTSYSWFSDRLRIKYKDYKDHSEGNWNARLEQTRGAIPLKTVTEYDDYYEVQEAVAVKKRRLHDAEFVLPAGKQRVASPFALDEMVQMLPPDELAIACYRAAIELAPNLHGRTTPVTSYVRFVLTENGAVEHIEAIEKDAHGLHELAENVIRNCGFRFSPGILNGKAVPSLVYFPVEFAL